MGRTIKITDDVHKMLLELGAKSETFSDIIKRVSEYYRKAHPKK
jgi:predicted CopG family antitoxin